MAREARRRAEPKIVPCEERRSAGRNDMNVPCRALIALSRSGGPVARSESSGADLLSQ